MKITALEVDGYGVWKDLALEELSGELNVFCGPNEAGKTTLMQFIRSVLYGFSPRRQGYLPPLYGGRPGGSVHLAGTHGRYRVSRHDDQKDADGRAQVGLWADDGTRQSDHLLADLLCNVDEPIFNNVFAIGLEEMQQLGTLGDTEAASMLYNISAGLDRVCLVDVMRELKASRNRILSSDGSPSQVTELLVERDQLRSEIEDLAALGNRYGRLAAERDRLEREVARLEDDKNRLQQEARAVEIAATLRPQWQRRTELDDQLAAVKPAAAMPDGAVGRLDEINSRLTQHQRRIDQLKDRRRQIRSEVSELKINEALCRQAARIEALGEQGSWIATLQTQVSELESEIAQTEAKLVSEQQRLGLIAEGRPIALPTPDRYKLGVLRRPAKTLRQCRRQLEQARREAATAEQTARSLAEQIEAGLTACGHKQLSDAIDQTGKLVSQLRRRAQLEERLDQMSRYQGELEEQSRDLLDRQLMPASILVALGGMFVLGAVLLVAGLLISASTAGTLGGILAALGALGAAGAVAAKFVLERSNARQLEACQKQLGMLQLQLKQARQECDSLDRDLPRGGGPIVSRLESAEGELGALEELTPLDARRKTAMQQAEMAGARLEQAESELAAARRRWRDALGETGLPQNLSVKQVRQLSDRFDHLDQLARRLTRCREELQQRRRELDALTGRITQLAADSGLTINRANCTELLGELSEQLREQEKRIERRQTLRSRAAGLRRKRSKLEKAAGRLKNQRRQLFTRVAANNEQEFRERAVEHARAEMLGRQRDALQAEINAAIGEHCSEEAIAEQLAERPGGELGVWRDELAGQLQATEAQLQQRFEQRGRLGEQLSSLAEDRRPAQKQLELSIVEKRLEEAIRRWQTLAVTHRILEEIRKTYERERQPETLREASGYLAQMTRGRYRRVWTPLGEDVLRVDDSRGDSLPVEALSRGTREQLFLSLRLALVNSYARRGARLPLVLDDVLVNFDNQRAKAAAAVLRDFARAGHQLLVFTCHNHIMRLFKSLKVPVRRLPDSAAIEFSPPAEKPTEKTVKKRRKPKIDPKPGPRKLVVESQPQPEVVEQPDDESDDESDDLDENDYDWEEVDYDEGLDDAEAA